MSAERLDPRAIRRAFERAAASYDEAAVLQRQVAEELDRRLDVVRLTPDMVLDAGCGTGYVTGLVGRRYPRARVFGIDASVEMVRRAKRTRRSSWFPFGWNRGRTEFLAADCERLPLSTGSIDLVMSSLAIQWCMPGRVFSEFLRVLRPGGLLMFTTFGPDTLKELRAAWREADAGVHVHEFMDMHDVGDALVRAGFADPVMDVDRMTLTYPDVRAALLDLKHIGASNAAASRARGLMPKGRYARFVGSYENFRADGRIPATYEVVYGHAWAPESPRSGSVVPLAAVRRR